jgi:hypothetical protein
MESAGAAVRSGPALAVGAVQDHGEKIVFGEMVPTESVATQYFGFSRFSKVATEASFGGCLVNSEIARVNSQCEIDKVGSVKSPSSKARQMAW